MSPLYDDREDDVALHTRRPSPGQEPGRRAPELDRVAPDRELTLSTGIVLGLFFALALLCAVFFGFGYSMGHKSPAAAPVVAEAEPAATTNDDTAANAVKPSASAAASPPVPAYVSPNGAASSQERPAVRTPKPTEPPAGSNSAVPSATASTTAERPATQRPAPIVRMGPTAVPAETSAAGSASTGAGTYVQVAAVSHQEDADVLSSALRRRGYAVLSRTDGSDHLIHVQIGPFSNRKEADAMRLRLQGDGYNAFLK